jgi:hypothetical protein
MSVGKNASGDHSVGFGSDDVHIKLLLWTVENSLDFRGMFLDSDSARRSLVGGEASRGTPPPPPPLRTLCQTLAKRGNNTKPRRVALRCQALTHPLSLSPVIRNRSLCLPHLSPTLVVRCCNSAEASPLPPSHSPSPFHLMAQASPEQH